MGRVITWLVGWWVLPRGWTHRTWPRPPLIPAYINLLLMQDYMPAIRALINQENPLLLGVRGTR